MDQLQIKASEARCENQRQRYVLDSCRQRLVSKLRKTDQRMFEELPSDHTNTAKDMRLNSQLIQYTFRLGTIENMLQKVLQRVTSNYQQGLRKYLNLQSLSPYGFIFLQSVALVGRVIDYITAQQIENRNQNMFTMVGNISS